MYFQTVNGFTGVRFTRLLWKWHVDELMNERHARLYHANITGICQNGSFGC